MFRYLFTRRILIAAYFICLIGGSVRGQSNDYKTVLQFMLKQPCKNFASPLKTLADTNAIAKDALKVLVIQIQNSELDINNIESNLYEGEHASIDDGSGTAKTIMHGNGLLITPNHNCFAGRFVSDKFFNGTVLQTSTDCKELNIGFVKGGQLNGHGIRMHKDSLILIGVFEAGVFKYGSEILFDKNCMCYNSSRTRDTMPVIVRNDSVEIVKSNEKQKRTSSRFDQLPDARCDTLMAIIYSYNFKKYLIGYFNYTIPKRIKHDYNYRDLDVNNMIADFYIGDLKNENQPSEMRHGKGFLITMDKNYYNGKFRNNKFFDGWEYVEDDSCQTIYAGEIKDFKKHGSGFMVAKSGTCLYGNFINDVFNSGKMCRLNPETQKLEYGRFSNGKFHLRKKRISFD